METEPTTKELMAAILDVAESIQGLAAHMDERLKGTRAEIEHEIKDFVDRRIADSESRVVSAIHSVDKKVNVLTEKVAEKGVVSKQTAREILAMTPV